MKRSELKEIIIPIIHKSMRDSVLYEDQDKIGVKDLPPEIIKTLQATENWKPKDIDTIVVMNRTYILKQEFAWIGRKDMTAFMKNKLFKNIIAGDRNMLKVRFERR